MGTMAPRAARRGAWTLAGIGLLGVGVFLWPRAGHSQANPQDHAKHAATAKSVGGDEALADQVRQLKGQVARLEAALSQGQGGGRSSPMGRDRAMGMGAMSGGTGDGVRVASQFQDCFRCHQTRPSGPLPLSHLEKPNSMRMGAMAQGGGMSRMGDRNMGMGMSSRGGMGAGQSKGMMDDDEMMGMGAMGKAKSMGMGMGHMKMDSTLPGFPGASHLYHIGAEGFFLNHDTHITLTADQREELNRIREKALLGDSSCGRKVEESEQELWGLTASDTPDVEAIGAKVREIETLRGDQRLAFIRAVGEAANQLTEEQRQVLVGAAAASDTRR